MNKKLELPIDMVFMSICASGGILGSFGVTKEVKIIGNLLLGISILYIFGLKKIIFKQSPVFLNKD